MRAVGPAALWSCWDDIAVKPQGFLDSDVLRVTFAAWVIKAWRGEFAHDGMRQNAALQLLPPQTPDAKRRLAAVCKASVMHATAIAANAKSTARRPTHAQMARIRASGGRIEGQPVAALRSGWGMATSKPLCWVVACAEAM